MLAQLLPVRVAGWLSLLTSKSTSLWSSGQRSLALVLVRLLRSCSVKLSKFKTAHRTRA